MRNSVTRLVGCVLLVAGLMFGISFGVFTACTCVDDDCYEDIVVTKAGIDASRGTYSFVGMTNGKPEYQNRQDVRIRYISSRLRWMIESSTEEYYASRITSSGTPPTSGWTEAEWGDIPLPRLSGGASCVPPGLTLERVGYYLRGSTVRGWIDVSAKLRVQFKSPPHADVALTLTPDNQLDLGAGPGAAIQATYIDGVDPADKVFEFDVYAAHGIMSDDGEINLFYTTLGGSGSTSSLDPEGLVEVNTTSSDPNYHLLTETVAYYVEYVEAEIIVEQTPPEFVEPTTGTADFLSLLVAHSFQPGGVATVISVPDSRNSANRVTDTVLVSLSAPPLNPITVAVDADPNENIEFGPIGDGIVGRPYGYALLTFDASNWNVPQTVTLGAPSNTQNSFSRYTWGIVRFVAYADELFGALPSTDEFANAATELALVIDENQDLDQPRFILDFSSTELEASIRGFDISGVYLYDSFVTGSYILPTNSESAFPIHMCNLYKFGADDSLTLLESDCSGMQFNEAQQRYDLRLPTWERDSAYENAPCDADCRDGSGLCPGAYLLEIEYDDYVFENIVFVVLHHHPSISCGSNTTGGDYTNEPVDLQELVIEFDLEEKLREIESEDD